MRKLWIFMGILFAIVFGIAMACAVWPDSFRPWFVESIVYIFGESGKAFTNMWSGVMATPFYLQWHPIIWVGATIILSVIVVKALWPRIPKLSQQKQPTPQSYQHTMSPSIPQSTIEPVPQNIPAPEPKKEEAVTT